jgi:hypothetical protein
MAKIDVIELRLLNWARWKMRSGGMLNYAGVNYQSVGSSSGYREAVIPIVDCEADETEAAIQQLDVRLRDTITVHYTGNFIDAAYQAKTLGCAVSTLHARISEAHRKLFDYFEARRKAGDAERERLASLLGHPVVRKKHFYEL